MKKPSQLGGLFFCINLVLFEGAFSFPDLVPILIDLDLIIAGRKGSTHRILHILLRSFRIVDLHLSRKGFVSFFPCFKLSFGCVDDLTIRIGNNDRDGRRTGFSDPILYVETNY